MIVHLMLDEKFAPEYIKFILKNFDNHLFIVYRNGEKSFCEKYFSNDACRFISFPKDDMNAFIHELDKADKIILHSLFYEEIYKFLFFNKKLIKKTVFVVWGGDIYEDQKIDYSNLSFVEKIKKMIKICFIKKRVIKRIPEFMTFASGDYDLMKKWYKVNGKNYECLYPSTVNIKNISPLSANDEYVNILVGNSATNTNRHMEVFDMLRGIKNKNIKVYCPLSYGDMEYAKEVIKKGKEIFNDKFIPILDYMTPENYSTLLSKMNVAIFHQNRQQATGNIEILSFFGAKIYLNSNITTWDYYVNKEGRFFFDSNTIKTLSFEDFVFLDENKKNDNIKYFSRVWDENYLIDLWKKVFNKE